MKMTVKSRKSAFMSYWSIPGLKIRIFEKKDSLTLINAYIKCGCNFFYITQSEMRGSRGKTEIVTARQMITHYLCSTKKFTLKFIGRQMGRRDHAIVVRTRNVVDDYLATDDNFRETYEKLSTRLNIEGLRFM